MLRLDLQIHTHERNEIAKRCLRILDIMKNLLFINNDFLINFWIEAIDISNYLQNKLYIKYFKYIVISKKI